MFKLGEPALLGSKGLLMNMHTCRDILGIWKMELKTFVKKHFGSIIILKMVNDPLRVWKENHCITIYR